MAEKEENSSTQELSDNDAVIDVVYDDQLPLSMPTSANVITGMVTTVEGNIIDNAIIEIKDAQGQPVRALKTNRLGQFAIATPLKNGHYIIEIDSPGKKFPIYKIETSGKIIPPISIRSQSS